MKYQLNSCDEKNNPLTNASAQFLEKKHDFFLIKSIRGTGFVIYSDDCLFQRKHINVLLRTRLL